MKLKGNGSLLLVIFISFILVITIAKQIKHANIVQQYQRVANGYILDISHVYPNLRIVTTAKYKFQVDDSTYVKEETISVGLNYRPFIKKGDTVHVYYAPKDPQRATMLENKDYLPSYIILGLILLLVIWDIFKKNKI